MSSRFLERLVAACVVIAIAVAASSLVLMIPAVQKVAPESALVPITSAVLLTTLALQLAFFLTQLLPSGRAATRIRVIGGDGWYFVIATTMIPAVLWRDLVPLALPSLAPLRAGIPLPLINAVVFMFARFYQLRRQGVA